MADHDLPPPTHADDVPRGGPWVICIAISIALVLAVAFAPQRWKLPLAAISILTLLVGVGMLIVSRGGERGS